jgi:hypothetical protein
MLIEATATRSASVISELPAATSSDPLIEALAAALDIIGLERSRGDFKQIGQPKELLQAATVLRTALALHGNNGSGAFETLEGDMPESWQTIARSAATGLSRKTFDALLVVK